MNGRGIWALVGLALIVSPAGLVHADIIFSNLNPPPTVYQQNGGLFELGPGANLGPNQNASSFFVDGTHPVQFDSALLGITLNSGPNGVDLRLQANNSNGGPLGGQNVPGTILETIHVSNAMPAFNTTASTLVTFNSTLHPLLFPGQTYWLLPHMSDATAATWNNNLQGTTGTANSVNLIDPPAPSAWFANTGTTQGAFQVNGTAVPEPSSLGLLALGGLSLLAIALRRRKARAAGV
jgi:hypothetical protein